jgi:predicted DNA-binding protein
MSRKRSIKISENVYEKLTQHCAKVGKKKYKVVDEAVLSYLEGENEILKLLKSIDEKISYLISRLDSK